MDMNAYAEIDPESSYPRVGWTSGRPHIYPWPGQPDFIEVNGTFIYLHFKDDCALGYYGFCELLRALNVAQRMVKEWEDKHQPDIRWSDLADKVD